MVEQPSIPRPPRMQWFCKIANPSEYAGANKASHPAVWIEKGSPLGLENPLAVQGGIKNIDAHPAGDKTSTLNQLCFLDKSRTFLFNAGHSACGIVRVNSFLLRLHTVASDGSLCERSLAQRLVSFCDNSCPKNVCIFRTQTYKKLVCVCCRFGNMGFPIWELDAAHLPCEAWGSTTYRAV